jgi:hypothetical protein
MSDRSNSAAAALDMAGKAASAYGREDLEAAVKRASQTLAQSGCHLVVVGEFKQGKSTLVNALLNTDLCPVDDDVATSIPTFLSFGDPPAAHAFRQGQEPEPLDTEKLRDRITEVGTEEERADVVGIKLPRHLLSDGLVVVDTPGVGGLDSAHGARTLGALVRADAVLFVSDASQELTSTEAEFLTKAFKACPTFAVAITKTDFYPEWRRVSQLTAGHLDNLGVTADVFTVSSPLRVEALQTENQQTNIESGFVPLVNWARKAAEDSEESRLRTALSAAIDAIGQMSLTFQAEHDVLTHPETAEARVKALEEARGRVETVRSSGGRWQRTLSDGISDLSSEISLRSRGELRLVIEEGTALIDENDPISTWDEFETAIQKRVRDIMVDNTTLLHQKTEELAQRIQELFAEDEHGIDLLGSLEIDDFDAELTEAKGPDGSVAGSALTALRSSYSGIMMFNMMGGMIGLSAIAPISIGLGVILGIKALKAEKVRRLAAARQSAKQSLRKFVDDASARVTKENQDTVKSVQRMLRDTYTERLQVLQRTTTESLAAAQKGATTGKTEAAARVKNIAAEMERLEKLRTHITALMAGGPT